MEIRYHLTEEDYLNFNMFHVKNSKAAMRSLNIQRFLLPIIFIIAAYLASTYGDMPFVTAFVIYFIIAVLWIIFYPKIFYRHVKRMTKRMMNEGKNEGMLGEHVLRMTDEGIVDSSANGETRVTWAGIVEMKEDQNNIYLYNSGVSACILPKRELHDVEGVRNYLAGKIK
ncbi:YcxB family protein [Neobacillus bataviensis]|uniref:YcxB family protein n=1 Tax=Neobacillus bataviensis TaxID=220685 RepID=UPI001CBD07C2|nr:YcxB family protein [Neobacillus bataviensis]